jgi:hypothetical protein
MNHETLVQLKEWYDDDNQLTRFDYQPLVETDIQMFGNTSISEIHDFKRGIQISFKSLNKKLVKSYLFRNKIHY